MGKRSIVFIIFVSVVVIILLTAGGYILFKVLDKREYPDIDVKFPGSSYEGFDRSMDENADLMRIGVINRSMSDGLVSEYLFLPFSTTERQLSRSERVLFSDQVELLSFMAERKDRKAYESLIEKINESFTYTENNGFSVNSGIRYCRVLLEGYSVFDNIKYYDMANSLQKKLYPLCSVDKIPPPELSIIIPADTPTPDFEATPTPKPAADATPEQADIRDELNAVDISEVDLYALSLLCELDPVWNDVYENSLDVISKSILYHPGVFYNEAYYPDSNGYAAFVSEAAYFDMERQLMIALHLAEADAFPETAYSFYKENLLNHRAFYTGYAVLTGAPYTSAESIISYACMARLARIKGDRSTYDFCIDRIFWNTATSYTSKIFGLTFIEYPDGNIKADSTDSILALKALY
ncbi:MAG: hypothetical protein WC102_00095 [Saccharofermentanales bacterium]